MFFKKKQFELNVMIKYISVNPGRILQMLRKKLSIFEPEWF